MNSNLVLNGLKEIEKISQKKILTIEEAANYASIDIPNMQELVEAGLINSINKKFIQAIELSRFLYGDVTNETIENTLLPVDYGLQQRYHPSLAIENISEEDLNEMKRRSNGEGSVYFNEKRNVWQVALSLGYNESGKRLRKVLSSKDKNEVLDEMYKLMRAGLVPTDNQIEVAIDESSINTDITFKEYLNEFMKNMQCGPQSRTFANYVGIVKHIEDDLGELRMSDLNSDKCQRFINGLTAKTYEKKGNKYLYSQSFIHKVYVLLRKAIIEAHNKELIKRNHMKFIKEPTAKKHSDTKFKALSDNELKTIINAVEDNPMLKTAITIMSYTGMRPGEAFALRFNDINFQKKTISISRALSYNQEVDIVTKKLAPKEPVIKNVKNDKGHKVDNSRRTIAVTDNVLKVIKEWQNLLTTKSDLIEKRRKNKTEDYIFTGVKGNLVLLESYTQVYDRHLEKKGLSSTEFNLYRFRHNYCTRLLKMGTDPKTVMKLMGDNTLEMVLRVYTSINQDDILNASNNYANKMDSALEKIVG